MLKVALAGVAAVAVPAAVFASPESILPPGFGTPAPPPPSPPRASPSPTPRPARPPAPAPTPTPAPTSSASPTPATPPATPRAGTPAPPPLPTPFGNPLAGTPPPPSVSTTSDLPPAPPPPTVEDRGAFADRLIVYQRPAGVVGVIGLEEGGIAYDGFGGADGRFLNALLNATQAPLASRWQQIAARRALLSRVPTPPSVRAADWVAARASFLARAGEADGARVLVSAIDPDRITPAFTEAAMLAALSNADPSGLCPYAPFVVGEAAPWRMAQAICAALSGEPGRAVALIERARRAAGGRRTPDILLSEKVIGASANGRRAVRMRWETVPELTPWRFGMAAATAASIPTALWDDAPDEIRAWGARAPFEEWSTRLSLARTAAVLSPFSAADLITAYSAAAAGDPLPDDLATATDELRTAYVGEDPSDRLTALRSLWKGGEGFDYAGLILTAYAAARVAPDAARVEDADGLVASLFTAGFDQSAERWAQVVDDDGSAGTDIAWSILAAGSPQPSVDLSSGRVERFVGRQDEHRAALLVAALAGLGRLDEGAARQAIAPTGFALDTRSRWSGLMAAAASRGQPGTVILLASAGLQVREWADVPPAHLYHILSAYRQAGLEGYARMIAAEALTRA